MARLEGSKPTVGAILTNAIIFALAAAGLFFAFRPVPEPTDAGLSNAAGAPPDTNDVDLTLRVEKNDRETDSSLTKILTPLPLATPTLAPPSPDVEDSPLLQDGAPTPLATPSTNAAPTEPPR